jgi:hypothetical protein
MGDVVQVGKRDNQLARIRLRDGRGRLRVGSDSTSSADTGEAVVTEPYNTQELTTFNGQLLKVVDRDDESVWLWCRSDDGARGLGSHASSRRDRHRRNRERVSLKGGEDRR